MVQKLRQVDVLIGQGMPRADTLREVHRTEQIYCPRSMGSTDQHKGISRAAG